MITNSDSRLAVTPRTQTLVILFFIVIEVVWLIHSGRPHPFRDDLWWIGPALGVAKSGNLLNPPFVAAFPEAFGTQFFFCQPPVFFYVLGGWIKLFGLGPVSIPVFYWTTLLLATAGLYFFLLRFHVPSQVSLLGCALFLFTTRSDLRPDPVAYAFCFPAAILLLQPSRPWRLFLAGLLSVLSVMSYPMPVAILLPVLAISFMERRRAGLVGMGAEIKSGLWAMSGVAMGLLICTGMIEGRWGEFLRVLTSVRACRTGASSHAIVRFAKLITQYNEWFLTAPYFLLAGIALLAALWLRRRIPASLRQLGCLVAVASLTAILLYPENAMCLSRMLAWVFVLTFAFHLIPARRTSLVLAAAGVWLVSSQALQIAALLGQLPPDPAKLRGQALRLKALEGKPLVIDGAAARCLLAFALPRDARSFHFGVKPPDGSGGIPLVPADASWKKPGEVWVFAQSSVTNNEAFTIPGFPAEVYEPPEPMRLFGVTFRSIPREPYRFFIVE